MDYVKLLQGAQVVTDGTAVFVANADPQLSTVAKIIDSLSKFFKTIVSPSAAYGIAANTSEARMDFNGKGGLVVGSYGVAKGTGAIGTTGVNDVVGVHGTAIKDAPCWSAGVHADVYDTVAGGVGIGTNIEFPKTVTGNRYIGVNMQGDGNNPNMRFEAVNVQGKVATLLNTIESQVDTLLTFSSSSKMFKGPGDVGGGVGQPAGNLLVKVDGQIRKIPLTL